ncbi:MAG: SGNH/GDSL hydrolase family protein [Pseudomonas sp.]|nr:SGNH/GDSL hydrolase family protein [Pseudomonas sp.]
MVLKPAVRPAADGEPNLPALQRKFQSANRAAVSIVQLGDSHTAADLFSGELRARFQQDYGNGGIGFIAGTPVPGTRYDQVRLSTTKGQWQLVSARNQQSTQFPLGGYLSLPQSANARVHLEPTPPTEQRYRVSALYQASSPNRLSVSDGTTQTVRALSPTNGGWRLSPAVSNVRLPMDLGFAGKQGLALGGFNLLAQENKGVVFSTLGINGATFNVVDKWQPGWLDTLKALKPDLLIIAYGTNEAFDDDLDLSLYQSQLNDKLKALRSALPGTALLIVGAPDSYKNRKAATCAARQPRNLRPLIHIQKTVAQQQRTLYWSWQAYMGGDCSIERWQAQDLARPDFVHFNAAGYKQTADGLYEYLSGVIKGVR